MPVYARNTHTVARLNCRSENIEMELHLDINCDVYKVEQGDRFVLALSPSLSKEGVPNEDWYDQSDKPSLADDYEYVMYGKVFKFEDKGTKMYVWEGMFCICMRMYRKQDERTFSNSHVFVRLLAIATLCSNPPTPCV